MLANRLNVLLAERQLSIKEVVDELGISRSAVSNIVNNPQANIATDTIDKLCNYLGITPADFFVYAPYQFEFEDTMKITTKYVNLVVKHNQLEESISYEIVLKTPDSFGPFDSAFTGNYDLYVSLVGYVSEDAGLKPIYKQLPVAFQNQLNNLLFDHISDLILKNTDFPVLTSNARDKLTFGALIHRPNDDKILKIAFDFPWGRLKKNLDVERYAFV